MSWWDYQPNGQAFSNGEYIRWIEPVVCECNVVGREMMARGRGRPRKAGRRTANGKRLSRSKAAIAEQFPERGANGPAQRREALFKVFGGPSSSGLELTCIGRLMLVGAFDGMEALPDAAYSALREYGRGYWSYYYRTAHRTADYQREVRGQDGDGTEIPDDPAGEWFDAIDKRLRDAGHQTRQAVHAVTVDLHWFPDDDADWAGRIINTRIVQRRKLMVEARQPIPEGFDVVGELACDSDWAMLGLLRDGATAMSCNSRKLAA